MQQGPCFYIDSVRVKGSISDGALYVPNAFTPGPDLKNDVFYAVGEGISEFHLKIFSRWGELIFESDDISEGWDGTYKGRLVQQDLYCWIIDYIPDCSQGTSFRKSGSVLLIQ